MNHQSPFDRAMGSEPAFDRAVSIGPGIPSAKPKAREVGDPGSPLKAAYGRLTNARALLLSRIAALADRLDTISAPSPEACGAKAEPVPAASQVVCALHAEAAAIEEACLRLDNLMDRLEV